MKLMDTEAPIREEPVTEPQVTQQIPPINPYYFLKFCVLPPQTHHSSSNTSFTSQDHPTRTPSTSATISDPVRVRSKNNGDTEAEVNSGTIVVPEVNQTLVEQIYFQELLCWGASFTADTTPPTEDMNPSQQANLILQQVQPNINMGKPSNPLPQPTPPKSP